MDEGTSIHARTMHIIYRSERGYRSLPYPYLTKVTVLSLRARERILTLHLLEIKPYYCCYLDGERSGSYLYG